MSEHGDAVGMMHVRRDGHGWITFRAWGSSVHVRVVKCRAGAYAAGVARRSAAQQRASFHARVGRWEWGLLSSAVLIPLFCDTCGDGLSTLLCGHLRVLCGVLARGFFGGAQVGEAEGEGEEVDEEEDGDGGEEGHAEAEGVGGYYCGEEGSDGVGVGVGVWGKDVGWKMGR